MRGKVTNIIPRMYGKSDFFTYLSVSPHSFLKPSLIRSTLSAYALDEENNFCTN